MPARVSPVPVVKPETVLVLACFVLASSLSITRQPATNLGGWTGGGGGTGREGAGSGVEGEGSGERGGGKRGERGREEGREGEGRGERGGGKRGLDTPCPCLFFVVMVPANRKLFMFMSQSMHSAFIQVHPRILGCKHWRAAVRLCHWILKSDTCAVEQSILVRE